jgi:hypothetical protein
MRDEAIATGDSCGEAGGLAEAGAPEPASAEACPAVLISAANNASLTIRRGTRLGQISAPVILDGQNELPRMVVTKGDPNCPPRPYRCTQFLYQVCQNYPPTIARAPSFGWIGGAMS